MSEKVASATVERGLNEPLLSIDNLTIHFTNQGGLLDNLPFLGDGATASTVHAVDDVSLEVEQNDVIALVGESGCGKTTLGKAAIGLQRPTRGNIRYRGQDIWDARFNRGSVDIPFQQIRRDLQIIHQDPGGSLNPNRTILSSLKRPLDRWYPEMEVDDKEAYILDMLERVGMTPADDYAYRYPHQLSGGEQQRVALVRALSVNPSLILADEAVSALDVSLRIEMMDLMIDIQQEMETSFIFISHNLANAHYMTTKIGGRIGIMYLGKIIEIGEPKQILHDPKHPYTEALIWSTPKLFTGSQEEVIEKPPIRKIDIPDATNPPSGCRFHTRCPEAREACKINAPELIEVEGDQRAACFRNVEDHPYWDSPALED